MIETQPLLSLVAPWLTLHDLWSVRSVSRACWSMLPRHTSRLVADKLNDATAFVGVIDYFPHARHVALQQVTLAVEPLSDVLAQFNRWQLTELELSQVWNLTDASVRLVTEQCAPTLEKLTLRQCFLLKTPAIRGSARLVSVTVENCLVTQFHADTTWPSLQQLRVSSRVLDTLNTRQLLKQLLRDSRIQSLDLSDCFMVEQILIDPGELPFLRKLCLRSCLGLKRVHVASVSLQVLDLALCVGVEIVVLDLDHVNRLDLSYLQNLTHLFIRSQVLGFLNLRACSMLNRDNIRIECPSIIFAYLEGTKLRREELTQIVATNESGV